MPDPTAGGSAANASDGRRWSRLRARTPGVRDRGPRRVPGRSHGAFRPPQPARPQSCPSGPEGGCATLSRLDAKGAPDPTRGARATRGACVRVHRAIVQRNSNPRRAIARRAPRPRDPPRAGAPRGSFGRLTVPKSARRPLAQLKSGAVYEGVFHTAAPSDAAARALNPLPPNASLSARPATPRPRDPSRSRPAFISAHEIPARASRRTRPESAFYLVSSLLPAADRPGSARLGSARVGPSRALFSLARTAR